METAGEAQGIYKEALGWIGWRVDPEQKRCERVFAAKNLPFSP
jgi:hypothetical protein